MDILEQLASALAEKSLHTKAPGNVNTATLLHQPGGLFTVAGMDRTIISTHISPEGLGSVLPAFQNNVDDPRYGLLTGFSDVSGSEATYPCSDAPKGYMKSGTLTAQFGRVMRQTNTIEIDKLLHESRVNTMNLQLIGNMLGTGPLSTNITADGILDMVVKSEMVTVGVAFERALAKMLWQGTPSANTAGGGYKEFPGLDAQIATGQVDAETNTTIPSADSYIRNFNGFVDGTSPDIVEHLSGMEFYLSSLASRTGMNPVRWVLVMREELWFELTSIWPCRYLTDRCGDIGGNQVVTVNDDGAVRMRDEMRNGKFIIVNGKRIPVVTDDGIYEYNSTNSSGLAAGEFKSSIYFVPLTVRGTFPVTYWEHIDYRNVGSQLAALGQGARNVPFWTDNGRFLWVYRDNGYCFDLQAKVEPRVILRTPHLAGKLQNVKYTPLNHLRDSLPSSPYFVNGGVSLRSATAGYTVWR